MMFVNAHISITDYYVATSVLTMRLVNLRSISYCTDQNQTQLLNLLSRSFSAKKDQEKTVTECLLTLLSLMTWK